MRVMLLFRIWSRNKEKKKKKKNGDNERIHASRVIIKQVCISFDGMVSILKKKKNHVHHKHRKVLERKRDV